jgi:hypothetical protein
VCGKKSLQLQGYLRSTSWEEHVDRNHSIWSQLRGDGDEVEIGLHATLILYHRVGHRDHQGVQEGHVAETSDVVDTLGD